MVHVGCTEEAALRSPGSALSQCKMVRPTGTADPVERKSSKDVPKGRGSHCLSGPREAALATAQPSPHRWVLTTRVLIAISQGQGVPAASKARSVIVVELRNPQPSTAPHVPRQPTPRLEELCRPLEARASLSGSSGSLSGSSCTAMACSVLRAEQESRGRDTRNLEDFPCENLSSPCPGENHAHPKRLVEVLHMRQGLHRGDQVERRLLG